MMKNIIIKNVRMNAIVGWLLFASTIALCGCSEDNRFTPSPPSPHPVAKSLLRVNASVVPLQEVNTRVKVVRSFEQDHTIGVFYGKEPNRPFSYQNGDWIGKDISLTENLQNLYAYFPYHKEVTNPSAVPVDISRQEDVLYGTAVVSSSAPNANIPMMHALSLVRVVVKKNDYSGEGKIQSLTWRGIKMNGVMDIATGEVVASSESGSVQVGGEYILDDTKDPVAIEAIMIPTPSAKDIALAVVVDGKERIYNLPEQHRFERGKAYTYTLMLTAEYNTPIALDECPVDVTYWTSFGKTDQIVLGTSDKDFFAIAPSTIEGADTYRMEGKRLSFLGYWTGFDPNTGEMPATWEGEFRMVLLDENGKIIEQFQACEIMAKNGDMMKGTGRRSFVTAPVGTYELSALFRKKGTTTWIKAERKEGVTARDMAVYVSAKTTLPAVRQVQVDGEYNDGVFVYDRPVGENFSITYILSNRSEIAVHGEIKAVWERSFEYKGHTFRPCQKRENTINDDQWQDEIGRVRVNLNSDVRFWKGIINCRFPIRRENPQTTTGIGYCTPVVHLYYKADGTNEWKLLRQDCDPLLAARPSTSYEEGALYVLTNNYVSLCQTHWVRK